VASEAIFDGQFAIDSRRPYGAARIFRCFPGLRSLIANLSWANFLCSLREPSRWFREPIFKTFDVPIARLLAPEISRRSTHLLDEFPAVL
jgi:hypothetical protein